MNSLKIKGKSLNPVDSTIYLNGVPIHVSKLNLTIQTGHVNLATISLPIRDLDIDAEVMTELKALVEKKEGD